MIEFPNGFFEWEVEQQYNWLLKRFQLLNSQIEQVHKLLNKTRNNETIKQHTMGIDSSTSGID